MELVKLLLFMDRYHRRECPVVQHIANCNGMQKFKEIVLFVRKKAYVRSGHIYMDRAPLQKSESVSIPMGSVLPANRSILSTTPLKNSMKGKGNHLEKVSLYY